MTSFNRRILFWFFLASIILCGLGISTWHSLRYLGFQSRWVNHTYEVMIDLDEVYIQLKEVQSHMRSYTLIGDARYLESYQYAVERAQKKLEELQLSVADNDVQEARLPGLETGVAAVLDFYARTYSAYQKSGQSQALMLIKTGEGQMHIDHVHELIREMRDEELRLLYDRRRETENATIYTMLLGGIGLVACFGIMAFVFWLSNREQFRRTRTETSLQGLLRQMESLNDERHMIAQMSDFLQSCRTNSEAYELIRQNMPRMFPDSHGSLAILSNSRNLMDVTVCWGDDISTQAQFAPEDCWGMRRGKMHVVAAGSSEPDCSHLISRMPESICVPLVAHGETLGLIYVASAQRGYFSDRRLLMLRTVCEQMSLALANMRLQDTLRMQTLRDPLTQLFNRRYMESSLERELLRAKQRADPGRADARYRPFQAFQRHVRPRCGRHAAQGICQAAGPQRARRGHRLPLWRGGIHPDPADRTARYRPQARRKNLCRCAQPQCQPPTAIAGQNHRVDRHRRVSRQRGGCRVAGALGRPGALPRQAGWPRPLPYCGLAWPHYVLHPYSKPDRSRP